jgi:phosphoglycerate dehydrogenase-like enzyme
MAKPKALYILSSRDLIYGSPEQAEIATLVDVIAPPQRADILDTGPALLAEVEIILSGWGAPTLDEAFLQAAPKLGAFFYGAGSVRKFVTDAFWERDIVLTSSYAANAVPVSEYALSTILLSLKRFWHLSQAIRNTGRYPTRREKHDQTPGAFEKTVGIVSLGMIGRLVCERLQPFDLHLIAYDPYVSQQDADSLGVEMVPLETLFAQSDVVSLHTPWLPETVGMITGDLLRSMKPNATLINTARGAVVHEAEMIEVLTDREDLWAVLDVTYPEPPEAGSSLYSLPNVILTPHIAGSMAAECRRMGQYVIADLKRYLAGEPLKWQITKEKAKILA